MGAGTSAAENKKLPRINYFEDILSKNLSGIKNLFQKATFNPILFCEIARVLVRSYMPGSVDVGRTKRVMDFLMLSARYCKSVYNTDVGRNAKVFRRSNLKTCIANTRFRVFGMFSESAAAESESKTHNWLNDSSLVHLSDEQVEAGCLRHEVKS